MKKILSIIAIFVVILSLLASNSVFAKPGDSSSQEIPKFNPSIDEMQKDPDFYKPFVPSDPIPESEMTHIFFSESWLIKNDFDNDPNTIRITFPVLWLKNAPQITTDDTAIELSVPTKLLTDHNESKTTEEITVSFPNYYFSGLPVSPFPPKPSVGTIDKDISTKDIEYQERKFFNHTAGDGITGARGRVVPYSYYNPYSETFIAYHEIEFYGNTLGDAVEIISAFDTVLSDTKVWFAIWKNGAWDKSFNLGVLASPGTQINYEFYSHSSGNYTECWLQKNGYWYYGCETDSTTATDYDHLAGSSELDSVGGFSHAFAVDTYPITIENLETSGTTWHNAAYVDQRLDYWYSVNCNIVDVYYTLNSSGLFFEEMAWYFP